MQTYSTWRSQDIAALIPGLGELPAESGDLNFDALREKLNQAFDAQIKALQELAESTDFKLFREANG